MSNPTGKATGWRDLRAAGGLGRLALICFGVWLHAADSLMVATIIPDVIRDIGGAQFIAWTVALYEIGSIVAGAASALLALRYGLRRVMIVAALLYGAGCLVSAVAPDMPIMLAGRLAQGLGGGGLMALTFVAANRLFERRLMAQVMAAISVVWGASAFTGPLVGGVFSELDFWRGAFLFFAVQAGGLTVWLYAGLRNEASAGSRSIDAAVGAIPFRRLGLLSAGVLAIAAAGIDPSGVKSGLLVSVGIGLLTLFLWLDGRRQDDRLLPLRPFALTHGVGAALLLVFCFSAATVTLGIYGPVVMTTLFGASALTAGYILALSSIGWSVAALISASAAERHDSTLIAVGMTVVTVSVAGFVFAMPNGPLWLIGVLATLEGAGFGMAWTFLLRRATRFAEGAEKDRLASAIPTIQRLGYAVGAAAMGLVANAFGFGDALTPDTARTVAFWIFMLSLPTAAFGLVAVFAFARLKAPAG